MITKKLEVLEELFHEAQDVSPDELQKWIDSQTIQESLKTELHSLLKLSDTQDDFLTRLREDIVNDLQSDYKNNIYTQGDRIGVFEVQSKIASGGMSNVYLANRVEGDFDQQVAIKVINGYLSNESGINQFKYEQNTLSSLQHGNIAHIYDGGTTEDGLPYFVMEYIKGLPFDVHFKDKTDDEILSGTNELLKGLSYAHQHGVIHRDLKPKNVFVTGNGFIKILDFGISVNSDRKIGENSLHSLFLSPEYASPELIQNKPTSVASDIYQVGLILKKTLKKKDKELEAVIGKACENDPDKRYSTAKDMMEDILACKTNHPISPLSHSNTYRTRKWIQRNTFASIFILLLFIALVGGVVSTFNQYQNTLKALSQANYQKERASGFQNFMNELMLSSIPSENEGDTLSIFEVLKIGSKHILEDTLLTSPEMETALEIIDMYVEMGSYDESIKILGYLDSIYKSAPERFKQTHQDYIYNVLANAFEMQNDVPKSDSILDLLLAEDRLSTMSDSIRVSAIINRAKNLSYFHGDYEKADSILTQLESSSAVHDFADANDILAGVYYIHSVTDYYRSDFSSARNKLQKAIKLYESSPGKRQRTLVSYNFFLALLYNSLGYTDTSLSIAEEAFQKAKGYYGDDHRMMGYYNNLIAVSYADLYRFEPAIYHYKEAIRLDKKYDSVSVYYDYINLAYTYIDMDSSNLAISYLDSALPLAIASLGRVHRFVGVVYSQYSMLYFLNKDYKNALVYSDSVVKTFSQLNEPGNTDYLQSEARFIVSQYKLRLNKNWKTDFDSLLKRCRTEFSEEEIPFFFMIQLHYAEALADDGDYEGCMSEMKEMIEFVKNGKNAKYGFYLQSVLKMINILNEIGETDLANELKDKRDSFLKEHS